MNDQVFNYIRSLGYNSRVAAAGVDGLLRGWRGAVKKISERDSDWNIHDFWNALNRRSILDEVMNLLPPDKRDQVASDLRILDEEFARNTTAVPCNPNKTSRATGENIWRDHRLPTHIKLHGGLESLLRTSASGNSDGRLETDQANGDGTAS